MFAFVNVFVLNFKKQFPKLATVYNEFDRWFQHKSLLGQ